LALETVSRYSPAILGIDPGGHRNPERVRHAGQERTTVPSLADLAAVHLDAAKGCKNRSKSPQRSEETFAIAVVEWRASGDPARGDDHLARGAMTVKPQENDFTETRLGTDSVQHERRAHADTELFQQRLAIWCEIQMIVDGVPGRVMIRPVYRIYDLPFGTHDLAPDLVVGISCTGKTESSSSKTRHSGFGSRSKDAVYLQELPRARLLIQVAL
jgi:hypothetical protein